VRPLGKASLVTVLLRVDERRGGVGELARPSMRTRYRVHEPGHTHFHTAQSSSGSQSSPQLPVATFLRWIESCIWTCLSVGD
jgi:hypothetical protein